MMQMNFTNMDIREQIANKHIYYYELADAIGISPYTLSVWLRTELTPDRKARVQKALASFE
jgi:hypothetical protein